MNAYVYDAKPKNNLEVIITPRYLVSLWLGLMGLALSVAACSLPGSGPVTPERPISTSTPANTASINGMVWHDLCVNASVEEELPSGCVANAAMGKFVGNGILESGELGLPDVKIELGAGPCPSIGLAEVRTDEEGRYAFEALPAAAYCVSANFGESHLPASLDAGIWTNPASGMLTLSLAQGERRGEVNFGWDFLNSPSLPTPEPTLEPSPKPSCLDSAAFIKDVTIPDGTRIDPGESFPKTWRLRNDGSCTWTSEYDLVFISGYRMGGYGVVPMRGEIEPGRVVDLTINLKAPKSNGTYWGYWMLRNARGDLFGVGEDANAPFWVKILIEPNISEWRGEYFNNRKLEGDPIVIRNDEEIDFNWKYQAPATSLPSNYFSARWTRRMKFQAATYRFSIRVDDGVRLWVDDRLVIDEWEEGSDRTVSVDLLMAEGKHDLKLEYFEREGKARIHFDVDKVTVQNENGWIATYWHNRTMDSKWALVKTVDVIDFNWGSNSPALGIPKDDFSARWIQVVEFEPGSYRLYARADDGIRVEIDGNRIIDEWHSSDASETYTAEMALSGSQDVEVEYFERGGKAKVYFWWEFLGPVNQPPVATADNYETTANEVLIVPAPGVLSNDEDPNGDSLVASLVSGTSYGTITLDADGSFVYLPDAGFVGEDGFTYQISDGEVVSSTVPVAITVKSTNAPPIANGDAYTIGQGEMLSVPAPGVLENDVDDDGQTLSALLETDPSHGSLDLLGDGSFLYNPEPGFSGEDQFTYRASDGVSTSEVTTVTITLVPANSPPIALDDFYTVEEDQILSVSAPGILANDFDPDNQPLQIILEDEPLFGSLILGMDGSFEYTPAVDFNGEDQFTYRLSDGVAISELAIAELQVLPVNDLPQAVEDQVSGIQDQLLEIDVLANDIGLGDGPLTLSIEVPPTEGAIEIVENKILYTPKAGFAGEDGFDYVVTDQDGDWSQASVFITIDPSEA